MVYDFFLQLCIIQLLSYIQETTDFIHTFQKLPPLPLKSLQVTLDVSSLYTNISHEEGVTAYEETLNQRESLIPPTADLCQLFQFILTNSSFHFNNDYYTMYTKHDTAVGTRMAPTYANLFMGKLEHEFLATQNRLP